MHVKSIEKIVLVRKFDREKQERKENIIKLYFHMANYGIDGYAATCPLCNGTIKVMDNRSNKYQCQNCNTYFYPLVPLIGGDK